MGIEQLTEKHSFRIESSAHAFRILSNSIYSDKISSIIREIVSNAYDSHVRAGTPDREIYIHLPTYEKKFFSVRDYGVGLTDEEMIDIYSVYFSSNKTNSNSEIGGFGLGAKSPFSYTDKFLIKIFKDNKLTSYQARINNTGTPELIKVSIEDSEEESGVEVIVPIDPNDIGDWKSKASIIKYFNTNISNIFSKNHNGAIYSDETFILYEKYYNSEGDRLIIGKVPYPIRFDNQNLDRNWHNLLAKNWSRNFNIEIHLNIGDVELVPSREELVYSKELNKLLNEKFNEFKIRYIKFVQDKINSSPNDLSRAVIFNHYTRVELPNIKAELKHNDLPITGIFKFPPKYQIYYKQQNKRWVLITDIKPDNNLKIAISRTKIDVYAQHLMIKATTNSNLDEIYNELVAAYGEEYFVKYETSKRESSPSERRKLLNAYQIYAGVRKLTYVKLEDIDQTYYVPMNSGIIKLNNKEFNYEKIGLITESLKISLDTICGIPEKGKSYIEEYELEPLDDIVITKLNELKSKVVEDYKNAQISKLFSNTLIVIIKSKFFEQIENEETKKIFKQGIGERYHNYEEYKELCKIYDINHGLIDLENIEEIKKRLNRYLPINLISYYSVNESNLDEIIKLINIIDKHYENEK